MRKFSLLFSFILMFQGLIAQPFFSAADAFFKKNVTPEGMVDYAGIKAAPGELEELVKMIATFPLVNSGKETQKAFSINAYNLLTIKNVINHYPILKPTDVPGFFDAKTFSIAGSNLTLSDIENLNIRPVFADPRMHFALVCAGMGCPPLANFAYTPLGVETQLEERAKLAMNDPSWTKIDLNKKTIQVSEIFKWYESDFISGGKTIIQYINQFRVTKVPEHFSLSYYSYNWSLNKK